MFMGIPDPSVWGAYVLCILTAALCLGWGIVKWNYDPAAQDEPKEEISKWAQEEEEMEEKL